MITVPERITKAGKVELLPVLSDCASDLFEAVEESRREISPWMHWCHPDYSIADTRQWVSSCATAWEQGESYGFLIRDAATKQVLGTCGIDRIHPVHRFANLGYWIRTSRTREGAATEATGLLAEFGFLTLKFMRIEIVVDVDNLASQKVAEKVGALREGLLRNRVKGRGEFRDAYMYSLVATVCAKPDANPSAAQPSTSAIGN
jgi:ribosomal-protein-serine acetyltransferase